MQDAFEPWLSMFYLLRNELIKANGFGRDLLTAADAIDANSLLIFARMNSAADQAIAEKRESQSKSIR